MKIQSIEKIKYNNPIPVYDVVLATPNNNFLIKTNTNYIVSHNCGILDEVNFSGKSNPDFTKTKIMNTYKSVKRRMQSRFTSGGVLNAKLFIVSSKKSEQDFMESYIETIKDAPDVYVVDEPQWVVKPKGTFSDKRFKVAVGNKKISSKVISQEDDIESLKKQGYTIIEVPLELKRDFERDVDSSLMEFAGISTTTVTKFITYDNVLKAHSKSDNPFTNNIISIGINDELTIQDFFNSNIVEDTYKSKPLYIHIDASLTGDRTGISGVWAVGLREDKKYENGEYIPYKEVVYKHAFSIGIQCPQGSEISLEKNRQFVYYLKYVLGYNVQGVSLDGYQSADSKQQFLQAGFNASIVSLDKKPDGYMYLKQSINEKRIRLLRNTKELEEELINLEQNNATGKIDHPVVNGSKDIADSLAGALYNASLNVDKSELYVVEDFTAIEELNEVDSKDYQDTYISNFFNSLMDKPGVNVIQETSIADAMANEIEELSREPITQPIQQEKPIQQETPREPNLFKSYDDDILIF